MGGRLPVAYKILLPFLALTMASGLMFAALAALELGTGATAQADTLLLRQSDAMAGRVAAFESSQQVALQLISGSAGLANAAQAGDRAAIQAVVLPMLSGQPSLPSLRVSIVATDGSEILTLRPDPADVQGCICTYGRQLGWSTNLAPNSSQSGIANDIDGPVVYTIRKLSADQGVVGALVVAQPLKALLAELSPAGDPEVALYFADGTALAASPGFPQGYTLDAGQRTQVMASQTVHPAQAAGGHLEVVFAPWRLQGGSVGYIGLAVTRLDATTPDRLLALLAVTLLAAVTLCLLGGIYVSRAISKPLSRLVAATRDLADGRMPQQTSVDGEDEIGRLGSAFNHLITSLSEHQAALARSMDGTLETLAAAIDARDPYTHGHSHRVAHYALALGTVLGLSSPTLAVLRRACLVHDIGKIGVPDRVLLKAGRLTAEERAQIEAHPVIGAKVLAHLSWEPDVLDVVRHHHERWDGTGYPDGLAGDSSSLLARVTSVADALDAMVSERVYRPRMGFDRALAEIERGSGTQFDPAVVEAIKSAAPHMRELIESTAALVPGDAAELRQVAV